MLRRVFRASDRWPPWLACAVAVAFGLPVGAHAAGRPVLLAPHVSEPLQIDGVLSEPAWARAPAAGDFALLSPREGQAPDESTCVKVLCEDDRVVFGLWCQARRTPHASLTARDQVLDGDHISVHVDTDGDGQHAYIFGVNPYGVELDGILTGGDPDFKWDSVWDAAVHRGAGEWSAEIAVPFRILRISASGRPWRVWIRRELTAWNEVASWPLYKVGESGPIMLQAGDLVGLDGVHGGGQLTVEPYVFSASTGHRPLPSIEGTAPWSDRTSRSTGVDVQGALTPSLVVNGTVHPDFSEIEADVLQIDVNRRFPLLHAEKRPFFLEGADHFQALMDLVETRRMADPDWGLKLTGRAGRWSTGALLIRDLGGAGRGGFGRAVPSDTLPSRPGWYSLARAQLPFGEGSNLGVLLGTHAQAADPFEYGRVVEKDTFNGFGGFDSQLRLSSHWRTEAQAIGSATRVRTSGIDPAFFDQVFPDTVREFRDWMGVWRLFYRDKARGMELGARHVGPEFRNELGSENYPGVTYRHVNLFWNLFPRTGPLQRLGPFVDVLVLHDHTGRLELDEVEASHDFEFRRNAFVNAGYRHNDEHWLARTYPQDRAHAFAQWTAWRPLALDLDAEVGDAILYGTTDATSALAWREVYTLNATARPSPRVAAAASLQRFRLARGPRAADYVALWQLGVNTTAQFTRRLSMRLYPQYDSNAKHLDVNGLLGYVVHPGTVFYAGVNSGWDNDAITHTRHATSRQFFTKASWRFAR